LRAGGGGGKEAADDQGDLVTHLYAPDWVIVAAAVEVGTDLVLIIRPSLFGWLLFGAEFSPPGRRWAGSPASPSSRWHWPAERKSAGGALLIFSLLSAILLACVWFKLGDA
jgi:hypothetical protein